MAGELSPGAFYLFFADDFGFVFFVFRSADFPGGKHPHPQFFFLTNLLTSFLFPS